MPDFKGLDPIIVDQSIPESKPDYNPAGKGIMVPRGGGANPQSQEVSMADYYSRTSDFRGTDQVISGKQLADNKRYDMYDPNVANMEDYAGYGQGWAEKMVHGVGKGLALTGTTFLQSTVGMVNGLIEWNKTGKVSSFYDNEMNRKFDEFNRELEDKWANYYTDAERSAHWYSPSKLFSANFIWDGIVKNLGFAAGAAAAAYTFAGGLGALSRALSQLPKVGKLFSVGKGIEALVATETGIVEATAAGEAAATYGKVIEASNKFLGGFNVLNTGQRMVVAGLATTGEAGFEAYQNLNQFRNAKIEEYKKTHNGEFPTGEDLTKINIEADSVGNWSMLLNMGLLSATNYIQFPKILGSSYTVEKGMIAGLTRTTGNIVEEGGKFVSKPVVGNKLLRVLNKVRPYTFSTSEGFEEGAQYAITVGTEDYYNKKYEDRDFGESLIEGIKDTLGTDVGMENVVIGGLSGALMLGVGKFKQARAQEKNTQEALRSGKWRDTGLNSAGISQFMKDTYDSVNRGVTLQKERERALKTGDISGSKDIEADYIINYLSPRIKHGRYDLVKEDINTYRTLASTEEGFAQLISEGKVLEGDSRQAYLKRLDNLEKTADNVKSLYQSLYIRYGSRMDEKGNLLYTPEVMDKMVYAAAKIADYDQRIPSLSSKLSTTGINADAVIADVIQGNDTLFNEAIVTLDNLTSSVTGHTYTDTEKDELKEALEDVAVMSVRRSQFLKDYSVIKAAPKLYQDKLTTQEEVDAARAENKTVKITTADGETELEIGTEYYAGKTRLRTEKKHELVRMNKLTILKDNGDGTIQVKDSTGKEYSMETDSLKERKLFKVTEADKNPESKFYARNYNTEIFQNRGKTRGGKRSGWLEYDAEHNQLYFGYETITKKGKITPHSVPVSIEDFKPKGDFKEGIYTTGKEFTDEDITDIEQARTKSVKDVKVYELNKKETRRKILEDLLKDLKAKHENTNKVIAEKKTAMSLIEQDIAKIKKRIETNSKRANFKSTSRKMIEAINRLTKTKDDIEEEISILEDQNDQLDWTITYLKDERTRIEDLPMDVNELLYELNFQLELLNDSYETTDKELEQLKDIVVLAEHSLNDAVKLLTDLLNDFKKLYFKDQEVGIGWIDLLRNLPSYKSLREEDIAALERIVAEVEDAEITPNQEILDTFGDEVNQLSQKLVDIQNQAIAKKALIDRFQKAVDDYKKVRLEEDQLRKDKEQIKEALATADKKTIETVSYKPGYEIAQKKMLDYVWRSTIGVMKGKPHQIRANTFGFNFNKMENKDNIRGVIINSKNENELWPELGLMDFIVANRDVDAPPFKKEEVIAMVMVDVSDGETNPVMVDVNGKPFDDAQLENPMEHIIFQVFPKDSLTWSEEYAKTDEHGKKIIDTAIRSSATKEQKDKILTEYPKLRAKMLALKDLNGAIHEIEASFGLPMFEEVLDEDQNVVMDKNTKKPLIDYNKRNSVDQVGLVEPSRKAYIEELILIPTLNENISQGTTEFNTPLGVPFLQLPEGLVPLKNRKHTGREAENIYQALYHLAKNMIGSPNGINSEESKVLTNYLKSVVYWDVPETKEGERKETASNSVFWEVDKYTGKFMLTLSNGGDRFVFTPDSMANNKDTIIDLLMGMYANVNNSLIKKTDTPYSEVLSISPTGEVNTRRWINYQAYLLSSKFWGIDPDDKDNGTARPDVPLATPMKVTKTDDPVNRTAIYFYTIDNKGDLIIPKKKEKKEKKEKKKQKEEEEDEEEEEEVEVKEKKKKKEEKEEKKEEKKREEPEGRPTRSVADILKNASKSEKLQALLREAEEDGIGLSRIKLDEKIEDFKAEDWAELEQWFTNNLPHVPIFRVRRLIDTVEGKQAWGMFKNKALYVFNNAEIGTAYHEAWHAVWRMFTTPEEQNAMENEFKTRQGSFIDRSSGQRIDYANADPLQIEERLAEEFRDYVQYGKTPVKPVKGRPWIMKIFYDIVNWIRSVFNKPAIAQEVDSRIEDMFKKVTTGGFRNVVPYDTNYSFNNEGFIPLESAYGDATSQYNLITISDVQKGEIMQHLTHLTISKIIETDKDLFNIMNQPKADLYKWLKGKLVLTVNRRIEEADRKYKDGEYTKKQRDRVENESILLMNNIVEKWDTLQKKHEEYLMQYNIQFDENDNLQVNNPDKIRESDFVDANKVDYFKKAHSALKLLLATVTVVDPETGENLGSSIGGVKLLPVGQVNATLLNRLQYARNAEEMIYLLQKLAKEDPNYRKLYRRIVKKDYNTDVTREEGGKYRVDLSHIRNKHSSRLLTAFWAYFNKQNPEVKNVYILENGDVVVGDANLSTVASQLSDDYTNSIISVAKEGKGYFKYDEKKKVFLGDSTRLKKRPKTLEERVKFLNKLGIEFKQDDVNKLRGRMIGRFNEAVDGIYESIKAEKPIVSFSKSALDISGRLLQLGYIQGTISTPDIDTTFFNINNERTQAFIGTNPASDLFKFISQLEKLDEKTTDGTQYGYLVTDSFSKRSVILDKLFDEDGKRIESKKNDGLLSVIYVGGTDNQIKGKQRESSRLSYKERLVQELNLNLAGYYLNLVPGDASMEWAVYMSNHISRTSSSREMEDDTNLIFKGYFLSELALSRENRPIPNVKDSNRKTTDMRFFKTILNNYEAGLHDKIVNYKGDPKEVYNHFEKSINKALSLYIKQQNKALETNLKQYNILKLTDAGWTFENVAIEKELTDEQLQKELTFMNVNYMINNIEMHKLIYADPYQYSDELKRIKNFNSPRQGLVSNSPRMNKMFDRIWNNAFKEGDSGWTNFNRDYFKSVTYKDVMGIVKDLTGYTDPFKETDGGGIISFPAYRQFRIRVGNWGDSEELQYEHDMLYESLVRDGATKEELTNFNKDNPGVRSAYTPIKPIVSGNKNNGNTWNDIVLDKFALYPVSLRLLTDIAIAGGKKKNNAMKLYSKMLKEDIDYVVWENSRKVGVVDPQDMYTDEGDFNESPFSPRSIINIPFSIMSVQTEVPSKDDGSVTRGSQITKLITMDMMEAGVPVDFQPEIEDFSKRYSNWNALTDKESYNNGNNLYKEIRTNQRLLEELIENGYQSLLKQFGIKQVGNSYVITDISKAAVTLRNEILKREVNDNIIDALAAFIDGKSVLEATPAFHQVRNILYSIADKEVISQKINGGMKVLIPADLLEENKIKGTPYIDKNKEHRIAYTSDTLDFYEDKDGKRVCEIMIGRWFDSNLSDEQLLNMWYHTDKDGRKTLTAEGKKILSGLGFRIPTQRQNSVESFVIKQFLPREAGDSVVLPAAMVAKTGGDYDIDKLTVYLKNVIRGLDGRPEIVEYKGSEKATRDFYNNMFEEKIAKQLDKIENKKEFKDRLIDILTQIEERPVIEGVSQVSHRLYMSQEDGMFYEKYYDVIQAISEEAKEQGVNTIEFLENQITTLAGENEKLFERLTDRALRGAYVDRMYKKALQNEYIQNMQNLASHPFNYKRLIDPNSAEELKDIANEIVTNTVGQSFNYTEVSNMMERGFMSRLRHAFISGKQAIGITAVNQTNHSLNQRQLIYIDPERLKLASDEDQDWLGDALLKFQKFNKVEVDGKFLATLSMIKNAEGKDISNIISQFVDGYVDISKGPWIIELGATPNVTSTWLFLIKAGVPVKTVAYFMNQPIIRDYLRSIENAGYSWLFMSSFVEEIKEKYDSGRNTKAVITSIPSESVLREMVKKRLKSDENKSAEYLNAGELEQQQFMLDEFLKYAKMAEHMFHVTQGSNFDTATFNDPLLIFKKFEQLNKARKSIISNVDELLEGSFVGKLGQTIQEVRKALGELLVSDSKRVTDILHKVLLPYVNMSDRDFLKIAQKAVADLFDYAVQIDQGFNNKVFDVLVKDKGIAHDIKLLMNSIAKDPDHPMYGNYIVGKEGILQVIPSKKSENLEANNIKLKNLGSKVYDQNNIIYAFRDLREYLGNNPLYGKIVQLAILQSGLSRSNISFTSLLPFEDFEKIYNKTLSRLEMVNDLENFSTLNVFQRNNWENDDIVPRHKAVLIQRPKQRPIYNPAMAFFYKPLITDAIKNGDVPQLLAQRINEREANFDHMVYTWEKYTELITPKYIKKFEHLRLSEKELIKKIKADMRNNGDYSYINKGLFEKVMDSAGKPLITSYENSNGDTVYQHVYKMINAWGAGRKANEFYTYDKQSVLDNGFIKTFGINNSEIIDLFKRQEAGVSTKSKSIRTKPKSTKVKQATEEEKIEITARMAEVINPSAKHWLSKEQFKTRQATQFIGQGTYGSSTYNYAKLYDEYDLANTGQYNSDDLIYVSSNGARGGRVAPVYEYTLQGAFENIDKAIKVGASFIMDTKAHLDNTKNYNIGELALAEYLEDEGYVRDDKTGIWTPKGKDKKKITEETEDADDGIPRTEKERIELAGYIVNMQLLNNGDMERTVSNWLTAVKAQDATLTKDIFNRMLDSVLRSTFVKRDAKGVIEYVRDLGNQWFDKNDKNAPEGLPPINRTPPKC